MTRAPKQMTLPLLLSFSRSPEKLSWQTPARMPGNLLAHIAMPRPVPQMSTPSFS